MSAKKLTSPFSIATVVVADEYVETFQHPDGLVVYLDKLCMQLDVEILSLERPITVKGSWKAIVKIDAVLKALVSTPQGAVTSEGDSSFEEDNSNFEHFVEDDNSDHKEPLMNRNRTQCILESNDDLGGLKSDNFLQVFKTDEDNCDPDVLNKWYFNSNSRKRTTDKARAYSNSGKTPPEPYVVIDTGDCTKVKKTSLIEIEQVLSQVYKKETIEKYQQKSFNDDKQSQQKAVVDGVDSANDFGVRDFNSYQHKVEPKHEKKQFDEERNLNILMESSNLQCLKNVILNPESTNLKSTFSDNKKKQICSLDSETFDSKSLEPRRTTRQTSLMEKKITESVNKNIIVHEKQKQCRKSVQERKYSATLIEELAHVTKHKVSRNTKKKSNGKSPRLHGKTNIDDSPHPASQKVSNSISRLERYPKNITQQNEDFFTKTKIKSKMGSEKCSEVETCSIETTKHNKGDSLDTQFNCDQCSYLTTKQLQLIEHKRRIHLAKEFKCEKCLKEFGFRKDLQRHMKCHRKADNCCDTCGKMYKYVKQLIEHKRIHADDYVKPEFPCKFCAKKFSTKYILAYHIKSDHLGMRRSYVCPTCGKSFSQKNSYIQHANVHLGIKLFSCEICGQKFSYEKSLKEHSFMHSTEKVFTCTLCQKSFRQASGLAIHLKVHKPTKDYVCSMCGKGFTQKQALVRHERTHGGDKPYECGLCRRAFADSSVLRRHMILIHKRDPKLWRKDTLCHIRGRSDFFINVLNDDNLQSKDFEVENSNKRCSNELEQNQQNISNSWMQENKQENQSDQNHLISDQNLPHCVENIMSSHFGNITIENMSGFREPVTTGATCTDMKPYIGCVSQKDFSNNSIITSVEAVGNPCMDTGLHSSFVLQNHSTLPMLNSISNPSRCRKSVGTHPHHSAISVLPSQSEPLNPSSFTPVKYHHRLASYNTINNHPVQYSSMMMQLHEDNVSAITNRQSKINTNLSHENHHHHMNSSITLLSSHILDISKAVASSSENVYI